jgi:hypothetical protein
MTLILTFLAGLTVAELSMWLPPFWPIRKNVARVCIAAMLYGFITLVVLNPAVWTVMLLFFAGYRCLNMLRVIKGRMHSDYLFHATRRTSYILIFLQIVIVACAGLSQFVGASGFFWQYVVSFVQLILLTSSAFHVHRQIRKTSPPVLDGSIHTQDLPSLSVLIPARNETDDLKTCLESLIASTYRKLEIIVLDDCSQNRRTPEIIKSFAHDGVRFIAGDAPPEHWLAKNYAYKRLVQEANSDLLLFCGVDTRFEPNSIAVLVESMLQKQKSMVSVVPGNSLASHHGFVSSLIQPGRYAWEFLLPRRLLRRPPILSTCWIISRSMLEAAGGFDAFKQSVIPERHIARQAVAESDSYSFMRASEALAIHSCKSYTEQAATAIRTRYPQLHRRPESVAVYVLAAAYLVVLPYKIAVYAVLAHELFLAVITFLSCLALGYIGYSLTNVTYRRGLVRGICSMPLIVLCDVLMLNYSMWQYEFSEVIWKGRNVCIPVMRVIPYLPKF